MVFKVALFCVVACLVQQSLASCYLPKPPSCSCRSGKVIEKISYNPIAIRPTSISSNCVSIDIPNYGGSLAVSSIGPISPSGIAIATDLDLSGDVVLSGELPFLSAVAFEGQFATRDSVPVAYGCGDYVGITEQIGGIAGSGSCVRGNIGARSYGSSYLGCGCKY
ncbi:chorion class B protein PC10-like [Cydia strobilella]|uniref:chorion class B protein PC10-like n=1 Tax=Cydia strobilella TaxID=1100964 RepID=UPI003003EFF5